MTTPVGQLNYAPGSTDTFQVMIDRINLIANAISNAVVTVDTSANGSTSVGNAAINGTLSAQTVTTNSLRGGNVQSSAVLPITSNVSIGNSSSNVVIGFGSVTINTGLGTSVFTSTGYAIGNLVVSTSAVQVGNSTVFGEVYNGGFYTANPFVSSTLNPSGLSVGANVQINSSGYYIGNSTVNTVVSAVSFVVGGNTTMNSTSISVGNSTVNAVMNSSTISVGGHSINASSVSFGNSTVNATSVAVGNSTLNTSIVQAALTVGSNVYINPSQVFVGNSSTNTIMSQYGVFSGTSSMVSGAVSVGSSTTNSYMVQTGFVTGNSTVNSVLTSTSLAIGNTTLGTNSLNTGQVYLTQPDPILYLNKSVANGHANWIEGQANGNLRWIINLGNGSTESGSNLGSDFSIYNYADNGAYLGMPFAITRNNGLVQLSQRPTWAGMTPYDTGNLTSAQLNGIAGGTIWTLANLPVATVNDFARLSGSTFSGNITMNNANPTLSQVKAGSAYTSQILSYTGSGSYPRWNIITSDASAESGSNAGSNFAIGRYGDGGSYIDYVLYIYRSSGQVLFTQRPVFNGQTPYDTGNFNPNSKVSGDNCTYVGYNNASLNRPYLTGTPGYRDLVYSDDGTYNSIGCTDSGRRPYFRTMGAGILALITTDNQHTYATWYDAFARVNYQVDASIFYLQQVSPSDARLKTVEGNVTAASSTINSLRPVVYQYNDKVPEEKLRGVSRLGFIAQEIEKVLPSTVFSGPMSSDEGSEDYHHLSNDAAIQLCAVLVASQKEMLKRIEELEKRLV